MSQMREPGRPVVFFPLAALLALGGWGLLVLRLNLLPERFFPLDWGVFVLFSLLLQYGSGEREEGGHALVGIANLAAVLLFGPEGGAWVAGSSTLLYHLILGGQEVVHSRRAGRSPAYGRLLGDLLLDGGGKVLVALASGGLYRGAGGPLPLRSLEAGIVLPLALAVVAWFLLDHIFWGVGLLLRDGPKALQEWWRRERLSSLLVELLPLPLALLVVSLYGEGDWPLFLLTVGYLIGTSIAIRWLLRGVQVQQRSARELALLNEVARQIAQAELSVDDLCELIYRQAGRVVDTFSFHLGLFEGERFTLRIWVQEGRRQDPLTVDLSSGEGIVGWMRQSGQPLLVRDFRQEMGRLPARPRYISDRPPRSAVFVPLIAGKEVIGSLSIQHPRPNAFTERHLRILSFIANQAALAIVKARLYEALQQRAAELERVAQENAALYAQVREERDRLELLYDVARDLTRRLDLDDLLLRLLQRTVESLRAEDGTILLLGSRRVPPRAICLCEEPLVRPEEVLERGLAGWVVRHRQSALLPDVQQDPRWLPGERPAGSALSAPLLHKGAVLGVLTLTHPQENFFTPADEALLQAIAEQAAVGLEAARLYEAQRRRAVQLQTIGWVTRRILGTLDLDRLLPQVVHLIRERFGYAHVHLFTLDAGGAAIYLRASTDPQNPFWRAREGRLALGEGLVGWAAAHGEPVLVGDVRLDDRWLPDQRRVRSEVAVPLRVGGRVVGVLDVQSEEVGAFDAEDLFVLRTLADQIAVALEVARLYRAGQEEAWVLNALLQASQNIAQAQDLDDLLAVVARLVPLLTGAERCCVLMRDWESGYLYPSHGYGFPWQTMEETAFRPEDVPAFARLIRQAGPVVLFGPERERALPDVLQQALGEGGVWLFPLIVAGEVSGAILVGLPEGEVLGSRQHTILTGIARQAGAAIEEARLRREAVERERLEQELLVARQIQQRFLPEETPSLPGWSIVATWQAARQVGGDFYDFIPLPDGRLGLVVADVSGKGVPAALFMALTRSLTRAAALVHPAPAQALQQVNRLLLEYTHGEMFVSLFYALLDPQSGQMRYCSAGHNPPFLCRNRGEGVFLRTDGIVLGVAEQISLEEKEVLLEEGDILLLYTDGITETIDPAEEEFGIERLRQVLCRQRRAALVEIRQGLLEALEAFAQGRPPIDDLTLVLLRRG